MKKIVKWILIVLLVLSVFLLFKIFYPNKLTINPEDQKCTLDEDCTTAMVTCSGDCGVPINKIQEAKYRDKKARRCKFYMGPMFKMICEQELKCVNSICTVVNE